MLQKINISNFKTVKGTTLDKIPLTYEVFGRALYQAPIVLVNHALTGNSTVCGDQGWWGEMIGDKKCIDTNKYTVLSFNIPGNGYDGINEHLYDNHRIFQARDIAMIFSEALKLLKIEALYAVIGGSVGGGIAWELAAINPALINHLIPIATDWKSTDWLKANCLIQEQILLNSSKPIHDARLHAMLMYRTPESFKHKFDRSYNEEKSMYNVESWLLHHGKKLESRFTLAAYKQLNHILANIDIEKDRGDFIDVAATIESNIHIISVDSDVFFTASENEITVQKLQKIKRNVTHGVINSVHGHDAFLIEFDQMNVLLSDIF